MSTMRRALLFLSLIALFVAGCSPQRPTIGGFKREKSPMRIVSLSPSATEILVTKAGVSQRMVGRTAACNWPQAAQGIPVVGQVKPDFEKIAQMNPDLIVYDQDLYSPTDEQKIKELGVDTYVLRGDTLEEFEKSVFEIGKLVGGETELSKYVDDIYRARDASTAAAITPQPKVAIILPGQGGEHLIAGTKSFAAAVVRASGVEVVGPDARLFVPLNAEQLLSQAPTVILAAGAAGSAQRLAADPRLKPTPAVRDGKVFEVEQDVILRRGGRVDTLINTLHGALARAVSR